MSIKYLPGDDISSGSLLRNLFRAGLQGSVKLFSLSGFLGRMLYVTSTTGDLLLFVLFLGE